MEGERWENIKSEAPAINEVFYCFVSLARPILNFIAMNFRLSHVLFVLCEAKRLIASYLSQFPYRALVCPLRDARDLL